MSEETNRQIMGELKLKGMLEEYDQQQESSDMQTLSFNDRLELLLGAERDLKRSNKIRNCHNLAKFAQPHAYIEDIIYDADRGLEKEQLLKLSSCAYLKEHENILVLGASD